MQRNDRPLLSTEDLKRILTIKDKCAILPTSIINTAVAVIKQMEMSQEDRDSFLFAGFMGHIFDQPDIGNIPMSALVPVMERHGHHVVRITVTVEKWMDEKTATEEKAVEERPLPVSLRCEQCSRNKIEMRVQPLGINETLYLCGPCSNAFVGSAVIGILQPDEVPNG